MVIDVSKINPDMKETDQWLNYLHSRGRKENSLRSHRSNVIQCLRFLMVSDMPTTSRQIDDSHIMALWEGLEVKETVRWAYLRSLSQMICYHTGRDIVKNIDILHNRPDIYRVFISRGEFREVYREADEFQRLILCLGCFMGLRRAEMVEIRDSDVHEDFIIVHGKGHGKDGLVAKVMMPEPVKEQIESYRRSALKSGIRKDDYLLQTRGHDGGLHHVNVSRVSDTISRLGNKVGIEMTTHSLRRFYASTLYYDVSCDLQTMRNLMRHAEVSTTLKCYVNSNEMKEREAMDKLTDNLRKLMKKEDME